MNLITHKELVHISKKFNLGFSLEFIDIESLKLTNHHHPFSLTQEEAYIIYNLLLKNNAKNVFEIATAFGISSIVMGQALSNTQGKLVTIDAYIEEHFNHSMGYSPDFKFVKDKEDADGYLMAKSLVNNLNLNDRIILEIGWSPDDIPAIYKNNFQNQKLDILFLDGGHSEKQIYLDITHMMRYLDIESIIFFHDHHCVGKDTKRFLLENGFNQFKLYKTEFDLAAYARGNKIINL
tara:strand:- start:712 stop:1419 length:708 start_codon:yes stop_codon:yes gene_type:complete